MLTVSDLFLKTLLIKNPNYFIANEVQTSRYKLAGGSSVLSDFLIIIRCKMKSPMIVDRLILSYEVQVGEKDGIMC